MTNVLIEIKYYILIQKFINYIENKLNRYNIYYNNSISQWIMLNIDNKNINNKQLLRDLILANPQIKLRIEIKLILKKLKLNKIFYIIFFKIKKFKNTPFYLNNKNKANIIYNNNLLYLDNSHLFNNFFTEQLYINSFLYNKLYQKALINNTPTNIINNLIFILFLKYKLLNSHNQQLSVIPEFYLELKKTTTLKFELFGSAINTILPNYCSLFYNIEKYFGSKGSFFKFNFNEGFYVANPPYDELIMKNMTKRLIKILDNTIYPLSILLIIPCWDKNENKYGKFDTIELLKKTSYIKLQKKIFKRNTKFFNYLSNQFISPVDVYFILLQNKFVNKTSHLFLPKIILSAIKKYFF